MGKGKSIFMPNVARHLLKMGNTIIDIKPDKTNRDRTIFVFRDDEKLRKDLATYSASNYTVKLI